MQNKFENLNDFFKTIIIFCGALSLLFLLKTVYKIENFPRLFFLFASWYIIYFLITFKIIEHKYGHKDRKYKILAVILGGILPLVWFFSDSYHIANLVALTIVYAALSVFNFPLRKSITIVVAMTIFDIVAVYYLGWMRELGETVFENKLPMALYIPNLSDLGGKPLSVLGLGDIAIPGLVIKAEFVRAKNKQFPRIFNMPLYAVSALFFAFIGLCMCWFVLIKTGNLQPALFYTIPTMLIGLGFVYLIKPCNNKSIK